MSHAESAHFLDVRPDTIKSWSSGRRQTPGAVLDTMARLAAAIERQAADRAAAVRKTTQDNIPLEIATTDAAALQLGFPCIGAQNRAAALVLARGIAAGRSFTIVPKG